MKVLLVGNLPKPFGGVATHCYYLAQELAKQNVSVILLDTHPHNKKSIPEGIQYEQVQFSFLDICRLILMPFMLISIIAKLVRFKPYVGFRAIYKTFKISVKIVLINKATNFDMIHTQHCLLRSLGAVIVGKALKKTTAVTVHGGEIAHDITYEKYKKPIHYNLNEAHIVITVSEFTKQKIFSKGINRTIHVVHNGVDTEKYHPVPKIQKIKLRRKNRIILTVAHVSKRKGIDILIKSIPYLRTENINSWIIGPPWDPGIMDELSDLIKKLAIENKVTFLGEIPDIGMIKRYNMADLFVLPTAWETEGFGLVNLEAMSCGIPVIASRIGAIPEVVVDRETGILVTANNPQELAKAIDTLILNRKKCLTMGMSGRRRALSSFSWHKMAEQTRKTYSLHLYDGSES